jgi:hypothetical protein
VAVFLAEVGDGRAGSFEDPQAEQAEHHHQREVAVVGGLPGGGEQRLEFQIGADRYLHWVGKRDSGAGRGRRQEGSGHNRTMRADRLPSDRARSGTSVHS